MSIMYSFVCVLRCTGFDPLKEEVEVESCFLTPFDITVPPRTDSFSLSFCSPLSIPSVVVTISTLANPQQSGGMHLLVARSVLLLPVVQADCAEQRPSRRRRTKSDFLDNKTCSKRICSRVSFVGPRTHTLVFLVQMCFFPPT